MFLVILKNQRNFYRKILVEFVKMLTYFDWIVGLVFGHSGDPDAYLLRAPVRKHVMGNH